MSSRLEHSLRYVVLTLALLVPATMAAGADGKSLVAAGADRVAIQGYDTVAYFTDGKAIKGSSAYEYSWDDAKWHFASAAHRDLFIADPDRYMPQFGGFCAGRMADALLVPANPETWAIVDGKLYMNAGGAADLAEWKSDAAENIKQANLHWPTVEASPTGQQP